MRVAKRCAVCGAGSEQATLGSTNRFGAPDLDLRPPEMMRSTMSLWIQQCPDCGYVSDDIEKPTSATVKWLKVIDHAVCSEIKFESALARRFYKHYLICMRDRRVEKAFYAVLHAAWACDDALDTENAVLCRGLALKELDKIMGSPRMNENLFVVRADLLRRTGAFDVLIEEYQSKNFSNDLLNAVIRFQLEMAREGDVDCYTLEDVEE